MGVPVVTLAGATHPARMGLSILTAAGLPELVTQTPERYIELACGLASDRSTLATLRAALRKQLSASPLLEEASFARDFGGSLRTMWRTEHASTR